MELPERDEVDMQLLLSDEYMYVLLVVGAPEGEKVGGEPVAQVDRDAVVKQVDVAIIGDAEDEVATGNLLSSVHKYERQTRRRGY